MNRLLIVITQIHTDKGGVRDEFINYWGGNQDEVDRGYRWKASLTDACDLLIVHGYRDCELVDSNKFLPVITGYLKQEGQNIKSRNAVYVFLHAPDDYFEKVQKKIRKLPSFKIVKPYSSGGYRPAPDHLLAQIREFREQGFDWEPVEKKLSHELKANNYKYEALDRLVGLLLQFRIAIETLSINLTTNFYKETNNCLKELCKEFKFYLEKGRPLFNPVMFDDDSNTRLLFSLAGLGDGKVPRQCLYFWRAFIDGDDVPVHLSDKDISALSNYLMDISESLSTVRIWIKK